MSQAVENARKSAALTPEVSALARELGVLSRYRDLSGKTHVSGRDSVLALLAALGHPVRDESDARHARAALSEQHAQRGAEPVFVAWGGVLESVSVWSASASGAWRAEVQLEDGRTLSASGVLEEARVLVTEPRHDVLLARGPARFDARRLALPVRLRLPLGYHRLSLSWQGKHADSLIIAAPQRAPAGPRRGFGVFAPVYALRGESEAGIGTLRELSSLLDFVHAQGGDFVSTLPMLAQLLDEPFDTSPFAPASRLFWNELFLDLSVLDGLADCAAARELLASSEWQREQQELSAREYVDARRQRALVHSLLAPLGQHFDARPDARFRAFVAEQTYAEDYALFRAVQARQPKRNLRGQPLTREAGDASVRALHLYAQWQMHEQLSRLSTRAQQRGTRLYLDMPVGVHASSFDVWREPDCFVHGASVGAPPDELCPEGQNWGFMPGNPEGQRAQHYRYFIASIRNQLRHAGVLRIDHVAGLSRVFCVPHGMHARDGLYLTQPQEELHAILALEAERVGCVLVGEDLGTVPDAVRKAMQKRDFKRMYVLPYELEEHGKKMRARAVPERALAAINTHDLPSFAGFWQGGDIDERNTRGVISEAAALAEHEDRRALIEKLTEALDLDAEVSCEDALSACLRFLGESEAHLVLVALEDLWGEPEPQNVPGTFDPERNFSRRMRQRVDLLSRRAPVLRLIEVLARARRGTSEQVSSLPA